MHFLEKIWLRHWSYLGHRLVKTWSKVSQLTKMCVKTWSNVNKPSVQFPHTSFLKNFRAFGANFPLLLSVLRDAPQSFGKSAIFSLLTIEGGGGSSHILGKLKLKIANISDTERGGRIFSSLSKGAGSVFFTTVKGGYGKIPGHK